MFFGVLTIFTSSFIISVEHGVMPKLFCALRCLRKKDEHIRLFRIPADGFQRKQWISAIGTSGHHHIAVFAINISLQVRGEIKKHSNVNMLFFFYLGQPSWDHSHIDFVPSIFSRPPNQPENACNEIEQSDGTGEHSNSNSNIDGTGEHSNSNSNIDGTREHSDSNSNIVEIGCSVGEFGTGIGSVGFDQCEGDASDDHGNCANNGDVDKSDTGCEEGDDVFFF